MSGDEGVAIWIALGAAALSMYSCSQADKSPATAVKPDTSALDALETRVKRMDGDLIGLKIASKQSAYLQASEKTFSALPTNVGALLLSIENVSPYANGSRIVLNIGNPHNVTISTLKLDLEWGANDKDNLPQVEGAASKTVTLDGIEPGSWNPQIIELANFPPAKLGYLQVENPKVENLRLRVE